MANNGHIIVDNEPVENVNEFIYLGALITNNYDDTKEIRRRVSIAKNVTLALSNIWKTRSIFLNTKKKLLNSLVLPIATYGSECWVLKTSDKKRLESFELWCYLRVLRISWTEKKTNDEVPQRMNCEKRLLKALNHRRLASIGHVLRSNILDRTLFVGKCPGDRGRGRPKTRLSDNLKELCGLSMAGLPFGPGQAGLDKNGGEGHLLENEHLVLDDDDDDACMVKSNFPVRLFYCLEL